MKYTVGQIRKAIGAAAAAAVAVGLVFGTDLDATVERVAFAADQVVGILLVFGLVNDDAPTTS